MAKNKSQLDHDKNGKAGGAAPPQPVFRPVCGMDENGVDAFLATAEQEDKGTDRFPWNDELKAEIKSAISGMQFMPYVKAKVNEVVVAKAGPGLFGRGPFNLPAA